MPNGDNLEENIMYDSPAEDIETLFVRLRKGDKSARENASKQIAQRFDRWFQTIATHRLGQDGFHNAYESACQSFSSQVKNITRKKELIPRAYTIIQDSIRESEVNFLPKDRSNTMLHQRSPSDLLDIVWSSLTQNEQQLFGLFYIHRDRNKIEQHNVPIEVLAKQVLLIRQKLKSLMKEKANITFSYTSSDVKLDLIPLTLFEAGVLKNEQEKNAFETWLLTVPEVCNDLMEFVPFVHSLQTKETAAKFKSAIFAPITKNVVPVSEELKPEPTVDSQPSLDTKSNASDPTESTPQLNEPIVNEIPQDVHDYADQEDEDSTLKTVVISVFFGLVILCLYWLLFHL